MASTQLIAEIARHSDGLVDFRILRMLDSSPTPVAVVSAQRREFSSKNEPGFLQVLAGEIRWTEELNGVVLVSLPAALILPPDLIEHLRHERYDEVMSVLSPSVRLNLRSNKAPELLRRLRYGIEARATMLGEDVYIRRWGPLGLVQSPFTGRWEQDIPHTIVAPTWATIPVKILLGSTYSRFYLPAEWNDTQTRPWIGRQELEERYNCFLELKESTHARVQRR